MKAILKIIGREESMLDVEQLRQPLRKGSLGIQFLATNEGLVYEAGYMSQAAYAASIGEWVRESVALQRCQWLGANTGVAVGQRSMNMQDSMHV